MAAPQAPYRFSETLYRNNKTGEITTEATDPDVSYTMLGTAGQSIPHATAITYGLIDADGAPTKRQAAKQTEEKSAEEKSKEATESKAVKSPPQTKDVKAPANTK